MALPAEKNGYTFADALSWEQGQHIEIIHGEVFLMATPSRIHQTILMELSGTIRDYLKSKSGPCRVYPAPFAVKLRENRKTIVEPDISVICDKNKLTDRGCTGAPDWIIEIVSPSNSSHDYIRKLNLYADASVREYWIVDPVSKKIFVYYLEQEDFKADSYTLQDKVRVNIYNDLWINFAELGL